MLIGFGVIAILLVERYKPSNVTQDDEALRMTVGSLEWKRHALATYYMHALVLKNVLVSQDMPVGRQSEGRGETPNPDALRTQECRDGILAGDIS